MPPCTMGLIEKAYSVAELGVGAGSFIHGSVKYLAREYAVKEKGGKKSLSFVNATEKRVNVTTQRYFTSLIGAASSYGLF